MTDSELAKALHVNRSTAYRWRQLGMPTDDISATKAWVANRKTGEAESESVTPIPAAGATAYDVRDRLQQEEQTMAAEISGLNASLEAARQAGDQKHIFLLAQSLKSARTEHRAQSDALLKAEARIINLEKARGALISMDAARDFVSQAFAPILIFLRGLPATAGSDEERIKLTSIAEAGLALIRSTAKNP
jgi:hypothetical protein